MNYFWSFLLLTLSLNAAYNPFFRESPKPKKPPLQAPAVQAQPLPLPPLLKPVSSAEKVPFDLEEMLYYGFMETSKGRFALVKVASNAIVLKEGDPFYANNAKYFIRNITSNYITVDDAGRMQTIYFTTNSTTGEK